ATESEQDPKVSGFSDIKRQKASRNSKVPGFSERKPAASHASSLGASLGEHALF
ncbi:hypothetical protein A2U01_0080119, partial [Trifolium medium]|nr:hypothetical protein [Trifolium medium]